MEQHILESGTPKKEQSSFRLRGFICQSCGLYQDLFGNDPAPTTCPCGDSVPPKQMWDQYTTVSKVTEPYDPAKHG